MKRWRLWVIVFSISLGWSLDFPRPSWAASEKDVLTVALGMEPTTLDPHLAADMITAMVGRQVYNYLFGFDEKMNLVPELAESYRLSADKKTWTLYLRKGIKYHDGEPFTSASVKMAIERILDPATKARRRSSYDMITSVKIIDDHTLTLTTQEPFIPMIKQLTYYPMAMLNPTAARKYGDDYGHRPVGTGPFKLAEWIPGQRIVLERNEGYWETKPRLKRIILKFVREDAARTMLLETGEADLITQVPPREAKRLERNKDLKMTVVDSPGTIHLPMVNNQEEPFNRLPVRRALNHAVDKKAIVESVLQGVGKVYDSPLNPVAWGHYRTGTYEYHPEKAKQLLAEAGYKDKKLKIELWSPVGRYMLDTEVSEAIQGQMRNAGIDVELIKKPDWGGYYFGMRKAKGRMGQIGYAPSTGDADQGLYEVYHTGGELNWMKYSNKEVDSLLEKARRTEDSKSRGDAYAKVQEILFRDAPTVWLYFPSYIYGHKRSVKELMFIPLEYVLFKKAYKE